MKHFISLLFLLLQITVFAQDVSKSYVLIQKGDSEEDIIRKAAAVVPSARQLRWQQLELTAFFHFGINTFTDREWGDGKEDPKLFHPTELNARQWVKVAKQGGIKQVILTAKHHDGFCLWPTGTTSHSVKSSPWKGGKGDVVKELADACHRYNLGFGIYLSPWDRNAPAYGTDAYNDLFAQQLTELLTNYGRIDEIWFDGANGEGPNGKKQVYDFDRWYRIIRKLQPTAVIAIMGPDVRWVGTETGYGREQEWSVVPADNLDQRALLQNAQQDINFKPLGNMTGSDLGSREKIRRAQGLVWYPAETDVSIRPGWFFHEKENEQVKTPKKLLDIYFHSVGRNGVLLLNIPPNKKGLIQRQDSLHLMQWNAILKNTFRKNLASGASIKVNSGKNAKSLIDGNYRSYWTGSSEKDTSAEIVFTLPAQQTFDVLLLQENIRMGQRVEHFIAAYWDGSKWLQFAEGTTIGYKRLLRFPAITTQKVRIEIVSSRLNPALSEVGFYKLSEF